MGEDELRAHIDALLSKGSSARHEMKSEMALLRHELRAAEAHDFS